MEKRGKNILIFSIIGILIIGLLISGVLQSVIPNKLIIPQAPEQKIEFSFDGLSGIATSTYFGSLTSSNDIAFQTQGREGFCGNNDGNLFVENKLIDGEELFLSSSAIGGELCGNNFIEIKNLEMKKGVLKGSYIISSKSSINDIGNSISQIKIKTSEKTTIEEGDLSTTVTSLGSFEVETNVCDPEIDERICKFGEENKESSFEIKVEEGQKIDILISTITSTSGQAEVELKLNFEEELIDKIEDVDNEVVEEIDKEVIEPKNGEKISEEVTKGSNIILFVSIGIVLLVIVILILGGRNGKKK